MCMVLIESKMRVPLLILFNFLYSWVVFTVMGVYDYEF